MTGFAPEEKQAWSPVKLEKQYVVRGGLCNKPHVLESMEIRTPDGISNFVRVGKHAAWMLKCGAGTAAQRGNLKRSKVIEQLKDKLVEASKGSAVADQGIAAIADDPMSMLDDVDSKESPSNKFKHAPTRLVHQVVEIKMHERPTQCVGSTVAGNRTVRVLARSTNQLWIAVEDVEWLINYVATEVALRGGACRSWKWPQLWQGIAMWTTCECRGTLANKVGEQSLWQDS